MIHLTNVGGIEMTTSLLHKYVGFLYVIHAIDPRLSHSQKTTVLVTMKTEDIVRKAKAMADKQNFVNTESDGVETNQE